MVRQYQVVLDPDRLRAYGIPHSRSSPRSRTRTARPAARWSSWPKPSTWCARAATCKTLDDFRTIPLTRRQGRRAGAAARRRARADGPGDAPRHRRARRRRRSRRRRRRHARRQERARDDRRGQDASSRSSKTSLPQGVEIVETYDRSGLIERAVRHLREKLVEEFIVVALVCAHLPAAPALGVRRDRDAAARRADRVHRHALPGRQRQHHVARRHRDRDRRDGRRGDRDDRERAQAPRGVDARASGGETRARRALARDRRRGGRSRAGALLLAAHHHAVVRAGVRARSAGRPALRAARLHQDLRDGGRGGARGHADPGADGLPHPRAHSRRAAEPDQPLPDRGVPAAASRSCCAGRRRRLRSPRSSSSRR